MALAERVPQGNPLFPCPNREPETLQTTVELQRMNLNYSVRHTAASSHATHLSTESTTEHSSWPVIQGEALCFLPEKSGILQDECFQREREGASVLTLKLSNNSEEGGC